MSQRGLNKNLKTYKFQNHGKQDWVSEKNMCQQCQKVKSINFYVALMPSTISSDQGVGFFNIRSSRVLEKILDRSVLGQAGVLNYSFTYWALTISNEEAGSGWQKLRGSTGGTRRKVWTRTKILSPNIRYFVAN